MTIIADGIRASLPSASKRSYSTMARKQKRETRLDAVGGKMAAVWDVLERRKRALIGQWVSSGLVQVQVEAPSALGRLVFLDDPDLSTEAQRLGRRSSERVAIVESAGNADALSSVWVAASYGSYKSAYIAFLKRVYDVSVGEADLLGFDVDHLLNRARAPVDSSFIRIEAVPSAVNRAWGSTFEKASSDPRFYANQHRERRTMTYAICAKLGGQMPPNGPGDVVGIARLGSYFRSIGLADYEAERGMTDMLRFAYQFQ